MKNSSLKYSLLLLLAAFIWGFAFVAQSSGGDAVGPYTFNCVRFYLGALVLLPMIAFLDRKGLSPKRPKTKAEKKQLWLAGGCCGLALVLGSCLQQLGLYYGASAGKAGFLTAIYILLVPILGLFFHRKCPLTVWIGVLIALAGLYLLCSDGSFRLQGCDFLLIGCAFAFTIQITLIDHFAPLVDNVRLSCLEFLVAATLSLIPALGLEMGFSKAGLLAWLTAFTQPSAWISILYTGILSSGVAYTLQVLGQRNVNPTVASLLMSFESVFAAIGGWIILGQKMSGRELLGSGFIFLAVLLAQLPAGKSEAENNQ